MIEFYCGVFTYDISSPETSTDWDVAHTEVRIKILVYVEFFQKLRSPGIRVNVPISENTAKSQTAASYFTTSS